MLGTGVLDKAMSPSSVSEVKTGDDFNGSPSAVCEVYISDVSL